MDNFQLKDVLQSLSKAFPHGGYINASGEFIAHKKSNAYFNLLVCENCIDVYCKVLEQLSGDCFKWQPYSSDNKNAKYHEEMLAGVNRLLMTNFTQADMEFIYQYLGNGIRHECTKAFVYSDFDLEFLRAEVANWNK